MHTPNGGESSLSGQRKKLPVNPSLEHLQKQAKRRAKQNSELKLAGAQQQLAREYGCKNWAELARVIETMARGADQLADVQCEVEPLPRAARAVDMKAVRKILSEGAFTPHDLDAALAHALWYDENGTWEERRALADLLIEHGADPDGQYGSNYGPIVFGTAECLQPESLQYLIDAGADVTLPPIQTKYGMACIYSHTGTYARGRNERKHRYIDILLAHRAYIPPEITPPILAIHRGDAKGLGKLLDTDASLTSRRFPDMPYGNIELRGATLLHAAVEFGEIECVEELLERHADINIKADVINGIGGQTPIFHAINTNGDGNFYTLEYLVKRVGQSIDTSVRATWRRSDGDMQAIAVTPLEYAEAAATGPGSKWRSKIAEELVILRTLDQGEQIKAAILNENAEAVAALLDEHPDLFTPALWPIAIFEAKSFGMTRLLLNRGLDPNACSAPRLPLHLAVYQGLPEIVEMLIMAGAEVNRCNSLGETPIALLDAYEPSPEGDPDSARIRAALIRARATEDIDTVIRAGDTARLQNLLEIDPALAQADSELGGPLFVAARSGREGAVRLLLAHGADPNKMNSKGNTPLWFAAQSPAEPASHRMAVMKLLLEAGADIHGRCEDGSTALHFAAWRGPLEVVEFLLSHDARSWMADDREQTPVDYARRSTSSDREAIIRLFTEVRILDPIFREAVEAIDTGDVERLRELLRSHPALIHQRAEEEGWFAGVYFRHPTLLHFVANNPYRHETMPPRILESTEAILEAGADIHAKTESENKCGVLGLVTSCEPARKDGLQIPLIELLVRRGADPTSGLDPAIIHGEMDAVQSLLRLGAKHTLMSAAAMGESEALSRHLAKGPTERNRYDALFAAARFGRIASVEKLLATGIPVSAPNAFHPYAPTVLHQAACFGQRELAEWLLQHGADLTVRDRQFNGTAANWAAHGDDPTLVEFFKEAERRLTGKNPPSTFAP